MTTVTPAELRRAFLAHLEGDFARAEGVYRRAIAAGQYGEIPYNHLLRLLAEQQRAEDMAEVCRQALSLGPDPQMELALGMTLLSLGRYAEGWPLFERRAEGPAGETRPKGLPFPEWQGEDVRSLVVFREQGFGDTLQFARFVPELVARGVKVDLMVQPALAPLLTGLGATLHPIKGTIDVPVADAWAMIASLPGRLGVELQDLPGKTPYLAADPARRAAWSERLPKGARIGVLARGSAIHRNDRERSLGPEGAAVLLSLPGAVNLHHEDSRLPIEDFADVAAIVDQLELVITVDSAVAHVAGAMGRPCWVLLPYRGTDWRWLRERTDSPWYPSLKLYRQPKAGDWASVLRAVAQDLQPLLQAKG